ncbi:MAG: hypothetical protein QM831_26720 [Kofleriaceae bacterium]
MIATLLAATTASAAPAPKLVMLEVDHIDTTFSYTSQLPLETREPGGLLVPPAASSEWLRVGLQPGDIVESVNGSHVGDHFYIQEGVTIVELLRAGKPVLLHLTIHPEDTGTIDLTQDRFLDMVGVIHKDPIGAPLLQHGQASGVRSLELLLSIYLQIDVGDIVRSIGGKAIHSNSDYVDALEHLAIGSTPIVFERDGKTLTRTIQRATPPNVTAIKALGKGKFEFPRTLANQLKETPNLFGIGVKLDSWGSGYKISSVQPDSLLAAAGFQDGDTVQDVDGMVLGDFSHSWDAMHHAATESQFVVHLERGGKKIAFTYSVIEN